jgi:hypothetical protein
MSEHTCETCERMVTVIPEPCLFYYTPSEECNWAPIDEDREE